MTTIRDSGAYLLCGRSREACEIRVPLPAGENRVRVWREHRGLTVKALADKAGVTAAYLSQVETGKRDGTLGTYRKLAGALGVTLDELVA